MERRDSLGKDTPPSAGRARAQYLRVNMFFVYVLKSLKDNKFYIGSTNNLERRIQDHNRGKSKSVKNRGPFKLIYKKEYQTRLEALRREKEIKSYKSGEAFRILISQNTFDPIVPRFSVVSCKRGPADGKAG